MRTFVLILLLPVACMAAATTNAVAAPLPSAIVSDPVLDAGQPVVAASPDGSATLAYPQNGQVVVAVKRPGMAFGAPTPIGTGSGPRLAAAANGRTILAWNDGGVPRVAIREPATATFTPGSAIADTGVGALAVAAAPDGRAYLATSRPNGATLRSIAPGSTEATFGTSISTTATPSGLAVTHQTGGDIGWLLVTVKEGTRSSVFARRWSAAVGAGAPVTVDTDFDKPANGGPYSYSENYNVFGASAVEGAHPSFLWRRGTYSGTPGPSNVPIQTMRTEEPFSAAPADLGTFTALSTVGTLHTPVSAATQPSGSAIAVWASTQTASGTSTVRGAVRADTGTWGPTVNLDGLANVVANPALSSIAVASTGGGSGRVAYTVNGLALATRLSPTAAPLDADPAVLDNTPDSTFEGAKIAGTGAGDTVTTWVRRDKAGVGRVVAAFDDVTPPVLSVALPALPGPRTSRSMQFSASAEDLWTPTTIAWDFGDGATATGALVEHTFAPGTTTARVTVTARDAAGNVASRTITEAFAPSVGDGTAQAKVTGVKLSRKSFRVQTKKPSKSRGSTLTFSLSAAATVEISVSKKLSGYKTGTACGAKKPKGVKRPRRCTYGKALGLVGAPSLAAGPQRIALNGKAAGKALKPGKYTLTVASIAPPQSHGTNGVSTTFTIKK